MNLLCIVFMQINVDNSIYNSVYIYTYVCYKVSDIKHSLNFDTILDTKDLHKIIYIKRIIIQSYAVILYNQKLRE